MVQRNLVVQTAFWGDLLLTIPLIRKIRELYPKHKLDLVCRSGLGELFLQLKLVDQVYAVDKSSGQSLQDLSFEELEFDRVYCAHRSFRSAWVVRSIRAKKKIGFYKWWNFWAFDGRVEYETFLPEAVRLLKLIEDEDPTAQEEVTRVRTELRKNPKWESELGTLSDRLRVATVSSLRLPVEKLDNSKITEWIEKFKTRPTVILAPGSVWATKRWPADRYGSLAKRLVSEGLQVALIGSPSEKSICEQVRDFCPEALDLVGQTSLVDLMGLLPFAKAMVCNDSGPMHMASAASLPTVAVFGPTTLDLGYRPWQDQALVVQHKLECRPCGKHGSEKCPLGTHACMKSVQTDEVYNKLQTLL